MDGVCLDLALLGNLNLGGIRQTVLHKLTAKGRSLLRGDTHSGGDISRRSGSVSAEELNDGSLDGFVGELGLGRLGRTLGVASVHLGESFGSESTKLVGEVLVLGDGVEEVTVSHFVVLSISGVGHRPIYLVGFSSPHRDISITQGGLFVNPFFKKIIVYNAPGRRIYYNF